MKKTISFLEKKLIITLTTILVNVMIRMTRKLVNYKGELNIMPLLNSIEGIPFPAESESDGAGEEGGGVPADDQSD